MAQWELERTVTQSVLERLIDREPGINTEPPPTRAQSVRLLKSSLRRDLEWLLNTRRTPDAVGREFAELERSLYNFGVPDLTAINRESSRDRNRLARIIEQTLATFEPRLKNIRIEQLETKDPSDRTFRFRIDGMLCVEPLEDAVRYDSSLEPATGTVHVEGAGR